MKKLISKLTLLVLIVAFISSSITIYAAKGENNLGQDLSKGYSWKHKAPKITKITLNQTSSDPLKIKVDIKTSSKNNLLCQIWGNDANGWTLIKSFDSSFTTNWEPSPTKDDRYCVQARIKDANTGKVFDQKVQQITCHGPDVLRIDKITTNSSIEGFGKVGQPVKVTVSASGSKAIYYKFEVSEENKVTKSKKLMFWNKFNNSKTFVWVPKNAGSYEIKVSVRNRDNTETDEMKMTYSITSKQYIYPEFTDVSVNSDASGKVILNTTEVARPGFSQLYKFTVGEDMRTPIVASNKTTKDFSWEPDKSGVYQFSAYVKDSKSVAFDDSAKEVYRVSKPDVGNVSIDSLDLSHTELTQPKGTTFNFNASASGGNELLYSFWRCEAKGFRLIQDYSEQQTFTWTPVDPGVYNILTRVKDVKSGSYEDQRSVTYRITDDTTSDIKISNVAISDNLKKGSNKVISVTASGSNDLMYKFQIVDDISGWKLLKEFSPDSKCNWFPKHARDYKIIVWVKDAISGSYEQQFIKEITISD